MKQDFFPQKPDVKPTIYAYELIGVDSHKGLLKVGYSERDVRTRIAEQAKTIGVDYYLVFEKPAMRNDGLAFKDYDVHRILEKQGIQKVRHVGQEWFRCTLNDIKRAYKSVKEGKFFEENRIIDFKMRPEQKAAVE